jgi:hypothetical protein
MVQWEFKAIIESVRQKGGGSSQQQWEAKSKKINLEVEKGKENQDPQVKK